MKINKLYPAYSMQNILFTITYWEDVSMNQEIIKLYANLILDKSIVIAPYESNNQVLFKYSHNLIIATIIKKNMYKFKHEFDDFTILRDEVYASYYESLIKLITKEDYTQEDMNVIVNDLDDQAHEITRTFSRLLIGYTNNQLKTHLIDHTRRDQTNNEYIKTKMIYNDELFENIPQEETNDTEIHSQLYNLLTESQKEYVSGERVYANKDTERKAKQRIKRRVNDMTERQREEILNVSKTRRDIIDEILDIEDSNKFVSEIKSKQKHHQWFADLIVEYVPVKDRVDFNRGNITDKTVKEYRKALFKVLEGRI